MCPFGFGVAGRVADVYGRFVVAELSTSACMDGRSGPVWRNGSPFAACDCHPYLALEALPVLELCIRSHRVMARSVSHR